MEFVPLGYLFERILAVPAISAPLKEFFLTVGWSSAHIVRKCQTSCWSHWCWSNDWWWWQVAHLSSPPVVTPWLFWLLVTEQATTVRQTTEVGSSSATSETTTQSAVQRRSKPTKR